jgi:hypothetical protein
MNRTAVSTTHAIAFVMALALGIAPRAKADANACAAAINGHHFAYATTGSIVAAPIASIVGPFAEVGVQYFDGKGNVSFRFNASQNGSIGPGTATGTYVLNDDCTGTFTETSDGFTAHYSFAAADNGYDFHAICQDAGVVVTRDARRQF